MRASASIWVAVLLATAAPPARAAVWAPSNILEFAAAITVANTNGQDDLIDLGGHSFLITNAYDSVFGTNGLPVISADDGHAMIILGGGAIIERDTNAPLCRIMAIDYDANVTLVGVTMRYGNAADTNLPACFGGGILCYGNLWARDCTVSDCSAWYAGGGLALIEHAVISDCVVSNNTSTGHTKSLGGGIGNWGRVDIRNSTITESTAVYGGGVFNDSYGVAEIRDSTIRSNSVPNMGGGVFNHSNAVMVLARCSVSGNQAQWGAGIHSEGDLTVTWTTIRDNEALWCGGAYSGAGTSTFVDSTFSANNAANQAGALYNQEGSLLLVSCTLSGNMATGAGYGGALLNLCGNTGALARCELRHCTLTENQGNWCPGVCIGDNTLGAATNIAILSHTIVGNNLGAGLQLRKAHMVATEIFDGVQGHNVLSDGSTLDFDHASNQYFTDPWLTPLADNGGPTLTHMPINGSAVINAGNPLYSQFPYTDQRGYQRVAGSRIDAGAVEFVSSPTNFAPIEEWRLVHFGTTENTGDAANDAAPAGDGIVNLVKYAFSFPDPRFPWNRRVSEVGLSLTPGLPTAGFDHSNMWFTFIANTTRTDVVVSAEWCTNLLGPAWTNGLVTNYTETARDDLERRRLSVPYGTNRVKFLRINARLK